jgi:tRNA nucleotidyltransferase (CCA-adding enzyme)
MPTIVEICQTVLKETTPDREERAKITALANRLEKKVALVSRKLGVQTVVRLEGSMAKDTWLSKEGDIDIFMRMPRTVPRKSLAEICLKVAREATKGAKQIERFADHPYLEAIVQKTRVNIVPCYDAKPMEWLSATDRTPYHTNYVNEHFNERLRGEVRLLKKFMKGIDVYGAEIKVGGFSGYLCELLIMHFRSFLNVIKTFSQGKQRIVVDIGKFYENRSNELNLLFTEPLVTVDPVDKGRNVASAVRPEKLQVFLAAARAFLKNPSLDFFYPVETKALSLRELKRKLGKRGSYVVLVVFGGVKAVPDVLWGQIYKSQRSLVRLLELSDFAVLRSAAWSDEKKLNVFILELEHCCIPCVKKHLGPPLDKEEECDKFLEKHEDGAATVAGPYVENGRWVVMLQRKYTDACLLLHDKLRDGGKNAGVAEQISQALCKGFKIFVNHEVTQVYAKNKVFAQFFTDFLLAKPKWLKTA